MDCLIAPGGVSVASAHGEARYWAYTSVFNGLDLPVFCLPVGEVGEGDRWEGAESKGDGGERNGNGDVKEKEKEKTGMESLWGSGTSGAEKYEGGSVGIQIVGRRLEEEKLLGMVRIIERDLGLV